MRYSVIGSFKTEIRKGFVTTSVMEKDFETAPEMSDGVALFLSRYDSEYCHHLCFTVKENSDG